MRTELVPEITVFQATEVTPLWEVTQAWLDARDLAPPFWAFAWAGGQALARFLLDTPDLVRGRAVLDVGTGGGIVAVAAALAGAARVVAVDVDPLAVAASTLAAAANGVEDRVEAREGDATPTAAIDADVVTVGDLFYDAPLAAKLEPWLRARCDRARVLVGDPSRTYVPRRGVRELASYEVPVPIDLEGARLRAAKVLELV